MLQQVTFNGCSPVAQLVEQVTVNHLVGGSSPSRGAICKKNIIDRYNSLSSKKNGYVKIPHQIDIDNLDDFNYAKYLMKKI